MPNEIAVTPLTGSIGARVTGIDLRKEIPPAVADQIRDAFAKYFVLVFPNEGEVGPEEQNRLAGTFGTPQPLAIFQFLGALNPSLTLYPGSKLAPPKAMQDDPADKPTTGMGRGVDHGEFDGWHTDSSFTPWLPRAAILRAEVISPVGGDTSFASMCAAYDGLSPVMQGWLSDAKAIHAVPPGYKETIHIEQYGPDAEERFDAEYPPREYPVVITHPENGRKALFVNPSYTRQIVGMTRAESNTILRFLFSHIASAGYVYRHHWNVGDVVVWDELTTLHRAPNDFAPHDRRVVRVTAGRVVPSAAAA